MRVNTSLNLEKGEWKIFKVVSKFVETIDL